jgi:putative oxidoreductase
MARSQAAVHDAPPVVHHLLPESVLYWSSRVIFPIPFVVFGVMHLINPAAMAPHVPAWVPGGGMFWAIVTGAALLASGISILSNRLVGWSAPLLALLLLTFVFTMHIPGLFDPSYRQMAMMSLLKDLGLAGGALAIGTIFQRGR